MYLSSLQKYIVLQCFEKGGRIDRKFFRQFYEQQDVETSVRYQESIITKSLERLINKELLIGFGKRTPHKWFVTHVMLTKKGESVAKEILSSKQGRLRFKKK